MQGLLLYLAANFTALCLVGEVALASVLFFVSSTSLALWFLVLKQAACFAPV